MNYTLTLQDVENYLDSKRDDEVIGVTCDSMKCLVAEAFKLKYPGCNVMVDRHAIDVWPPRAIDWSYIRIDPGVSAIVERFDTFFGWDDGPVTKREWEAV